MTETADHKERRGFASMSREKHREICSKGGKAAHAKGAAHEWNIEEAREAGRKGGMISRGGQGRLTTSEGGRKRTPPHPDTPVGTTGPTES